jgi:hypothetical protein
LGGVVSLFTRFDSKWEAVFRGRKRTRCIGGEGAGWVIGAVKVKDHPAFFWRVRVEEATPAVGFASVGQVPEDEKKPPISGVV